MKKIELLYSENKKYERLILLILMIIKIHKYILK